MLDVLHFFFEEDVLSIASAEQSDAINATRTQLYSTLYNRSYKHATGSDKSARSYVNGSSVDLPQEETEYDEIPTPLDPAARSSSPFPAKPYVPPTRINSESSLPFGSVLDGPLG